MTERKVTGGRPFTLEEREARGQQRIMLWLDGPALEALTYLAGLASEERGLPPARCRSVAIRAALVESAARHRGRGKTRGG